MQLDAPGFPNGLYRQAVPPEDFPVLDVAPPHTGGRPVQWIANGDASLCIRGVIMQDGDMCSLHVRKQQTAHKGSEKWTNTCIRLGLPLPPIDPHAPPTFSSWQQVLDWDATEPTEVGHAAPVRS